jgi:4-hydroxy 2-oxovalerate aldolase
MKKIILTDSSLRDGNHCVKHSISLDTIAKYCQFADKVGIPIVEVGHGNGLAASSILVGKTLNSDFEMLTTARKYLSKSRLGIHMIPGLATLDNAKMAIDIGVDVIRVATHCTEATVAKTHIEFLSTQFITVYGVLMMSAHINANELLGQAKLMEEYGAQGVIIMDSTGSYLPNDIKERISLLTTDLSIPIGFHAHNNLGCAIANSITAAECGAEIIDGCIRGFGAGAGNAALEILIPAFQKSGFDTGIDFEETIKEADRVMNYLIPSASITEPINVLTGLKKLFSGFDKPILHAASTYGIEYSSLILALGERKLVAGQEDIIIEVAQQLKNKLSTLN